MNTNLGLLILCYAVFCPVIYAKVESECIIQQIYSLIVCLSYSSCIYCTFEIIMDVESYICITA